MFPDINFKKDKAIFAEYGCEMADWIWEHTDIIDDYLKEHPRNEVRIQRYSYQLEKMHSWPLDRRTPSEIRICIPGEITLRIYGSGYCFSI